MAQNINNNLIIFAISLLLQSLIVWQNINSYAIHRQGYEYLFGNYTGGGDGKEEPKYRVVGANLQGKYYNGLMKIELYGQEDFPQYHVQTFVHYFLHPLIAADNTKNALLSWEVVEVTRTWPLSGVISKQDCFAAQRFKPDRGNSKVYYTIPKIGEESHKSNWLFPIFIPVQHSFAIIQAAHNNKTNDRDPAVGAIRLVHYLNGKREKLECFEYEEWKYIDFSYWTCHPPPAEEHITTEYMSMIRTQIATLLNVHILKVVPDRPCKCYNCQHIAARPWHYKVTLTGNDHDISNLQLQMQKGVIMNYHTCESQEQNWISSL